jgi:simple sugar transport system substrate-binding protein
MKIKKGLVGLVSIGLLAGAAMAPATAVAQDDIRISVVVHGQPGDAFWTVVQNAVAEADADLEGVTVEYSSPSRFDMIEMSQLIDTAVATQPDGLVVSIPDATGLADSITAAVEAGIPVVSMNSGSDVYRDLGVLIHVGQTEYEAGFGGGERMAAAGVTNALCVNQEVGNVALDLRCGGFTDAMAEAGGTVEVIAVDLADPAGSQATVEASLAANPDVDGILTLGPTGAAPTLAALTELDLLGSIQLATFDLSPDVLQAIADGDVLFAIDQQQWLQGYLPIVILSQYAKYGVIPGGGGVILTGPGFVTQDNAAQVIELSAAGIR